ncbi:MAG TPA: alpha/beta hydrolase [Candidatus Dormibacteraeota bacterium]|jgi:pimeloyl-ACP methyl ester carboxylesterase|nr:alpha/beta hydrolase [Candidatus Dormibacteraeota bacterium]
MLIRYLRAFLFLSLASALSDPQIPTSTGKLISVGGHKMHLNCTGQGSPTVVVEAGIGDISTDWIFVQTAVSKFTRICTYDRVGYAWSEPGPLPRTYTQVNFDLHELLAAAHEKGPFALVGHSFGGPLVRWYTKLYPTEVAGLLLVDTIHEDQRIPIMGKATLLRGSATGRTIPAPRLALSPDDLKPQFVPAGNDPVEPPMDKLPLVNQKIDQWAVVQPNLRAMAQSELDWSPESLALMAASPQKSSLGARPLIVLTREHGGYDDNLDVPASVLEEERLALQKKLVELSTNGTQRILPCGHNMHIECPDALTDAIHAVVTAIRTGRKLTVTNGAS